MSLAALLAGGLAAATAPATKATRPDRRALYEKHCAVCHGADARGDFPAAKVRATTDGRMPVKGRLPSVMPIWGETLKTPENRYSEAAVRDQISALVDYLRTLQAAPEDRQAGDVSLR